MPIDLLPFVLDPLISGLAKAGGLRVKREPGSQDHVIAEPAMFLQELQEWLFEGRWEITSEQRLRPDPVVGLPTDAQKRFLFRPTPQDYSYLRKDFRERWFDSGPGWFLEEALPDWVPASVKTTIGEVDRAGGLRRSLAPVVKVFDGTPPWGQIVFWYGRGDFLNYYESKVYQEFPEAPEFYAGLRGGNITERDARLLHHVYTNWNRDMRYFVVEKGMAPDNAKLEIRRIWGEVFKGVIEGAMVIVTSGAAISGLNRLAQAADETIEAMLNSFRSNRQLFSLWARQRSTWEVIYRGTSLRRILRDVTVAAEQHDLGAGTYFTTLRRVAETFSRREQTSDNPAVVLRLTIRDRKVFGRTLDLAEGELAEGWKNSIKDVPGKLANERYYNALHNYLASQGKTMEEFDTIIAPEYLNGGVQICIKNDSIVEKLLLLSEEVPK